MRRNRLFLHLVVAAACCLMVLHQPPPTAAEPLPSWNDGKSKTAIVDFVARVTAGDSPDYVPAAERIATFDNDGTLWCEKPIYVQAQFAIERVRHLAPRHPSWKTTPPMQFVLDDDAPALLQTGSRGWVELIAAAHAGHTNEQFERTVLEWLASARHPRFERPYTELVYQPMLELLEYLRANDFQTFIVSGGGSDFMRPWTTQVYGVPPQQVVGSTVVTRFELQDGKPALVRLPQLEFLDDGDGKPVGIGRSIGRVPILAFGNSDGDLQMLQYTTMRPGPSLGLIVHHTDARREYAYDRDSDVGHLDKALDQAPQRGWIVVSMKDDWKVIFPPEGASGGD